MSGSELVTGLLELTVKEGSKMVGTWFNYLYSEYSDLKRIGLNYGTYTVYDGAYVDVFCS